MSMITVSAYRYYGPAAPRRDGIGVEIEGTTVYRDGVMLGSVTEIAVDGNDFEFASGALDAIVPPRGPFTITYQPIRSAQGSAQ